MGALGNVPGHAAGWTGGLTHSTGGFGCLATARQCPYPRLHSLPAAHTDGPHHQPACHSNCGSLVDMFLQGPRQSCLARESRLCGSCCRAGRRVCQARARIKQGACRRASRLVPSALPVPHICSAGIQFCHGAAPQCQGVLMVLQHRHTVLCCYGASRKPLRGKWRWQFQCSGTDGQPDCCVLP